MQRALYLLLALVFLAFAALNLNDPDPVIWVLAYGSVAILYAMAALGRADRRISGWLGVALAVWMFTMLPGMVSWLQAGTPSIVEEMKATEPHIEVVREFLGLLIAVVALLGLTWRTPSEARLG